MGLQSLNLVRVFHHRLGSIVDVNAVASDIHLLDGLGVGRGCQALNRAVALQDKIRNPRPREQFGSRDVQARPFSGFTA